MFSPLPKIAAPAQRALDSMAVTNLEELSKHSENEIKNLHGMGPNALGKLKDAMAANNLTFAK